MFSWSTGVCLNLATLVKTYKNRKYFLYMTCRSCRIDTKILHYISSCWSHSHCHVNTKVLISTLRYDEILHEKRVYFNEKNASCQNIGTCHPLCECLKIPDIIMSWEFDMTQYPIKFEIIEYALSKFLEIICLLFIVWDNSKHWEN